MNIKTCLLYHTVTSRQYTFFTLSYISRFLVLIYILFFFFWLLLFYSTQLNWSHYIYIYINWLFIYILTFLFTSFMYAHCFSNHRVCLYKLIYTCWQSRYITAMLASRGILATCLHSIQYTTWYTTLLYTVQCIVYMGSTNTPVD